MLPPAAVRRCYWLPWRSPFPKRYRVAFSTATHPAATDEFGDIHAMRFGIWALVHGSRGALQDSDEPYDASSESNLALVHEAERVGDDSTLVAQHTTNPHYAPNDQLEAWTSSAALAAATSRIEI